LGAALRKILVDNVLEHDLLMLSKVSGVHEGVRQRVDEDNLPDELPFSLRNEFGANASNLFGKENNLAVLQSIYSNEAHTSSTRLQAAKNVFYEEAFSIDDREKAANEYVNLCVSKGRTHYFNTLSTASVHCEIAEIFRKAAREHSSLVGREIPLPVGDVRLTIPQSKKQTN
jgi:hypothetical protein